MKPVGLVDQTFLWLERRNQPMHVGGLMLMTPPPEEPDFVGQLVEKLLAATRAEAPFNQRLARRLGVWFWEEDPEFDIEAHVRHVALPRPGRIRELLTLVSRIHGNLLDRAKPLWELYVIDGIEDGRAAVYFKIHHALADGVAGARMMQRAMSEDPDDRARLPLWAQPPRAAPVTDLAPAPRGDAIAGIIAAARGQLAAIRTVTRELVRPLVNGEEKDYVSAYQAPRTVLNQRITGSRRFAAQAWPLERIKAVGKRHGATVNDVVLAMCGSALRRYLGDLAQLPQKPLIAMVPVSLRRDDSESGNQVAMVLANLGTHLADPVERLATVVRSVRVAKERFARMTPQEILTYSGAELSLVGLNMATGIAPTLQAFNVVISNVPGPKQQLYFHGARVDGAYPVSIVVDGQALNITLTSYADKLAFGLIACRRSVPHMQQLLGHLEDAIVELESAATRSSAFA